MADLTRTDNFIASLGFEAYRVGGSVRDELLGRESKDADYVVRADMFDLEDALNAEDVGVSSLRLRDGTRVGYRAHSKRLGTIEIVLPRGERSTGPGHGDFEVIVDPDLDLAEDARRRDFTINAMYRVVRHDMIHAGHILDPLHGDDDLNRKLVNVTHGDSFRDDPLRTLRALRFVSTLGFDLGRETLALMALHSDAVDGLTAKGVSGTVIAELIKLLMGRDVAKALRIARDTGVLARVLPELAPMIGFEQGSRYHDMTTDEHTFTALETAAHVEAPLRVRLALLFHDAGKPDTAWVGTDGRKHYYATFANPADPSKPTEDHEVVGERIWNEAAARLGVERRLKMDVAALIANHMVPCQKVNAVRVRRERVRLGDSMLRDLLLMRMCDLSGKGTKNMKFLDNVGQMEGHRRVAEHDNVPARVRDLAIDGNDLLRIGIPGGRFMGEILAGVLDEVVVDPSEQKRTRDWQMDAARRLS